MVNLLCDVDLPLLDMYSSILLPKSSILLPKSATNLEVNNYEDENLGGGGTTNFYDLSNNNIKKNIKKYKNNGVINNDNFWKKLTNENENRELFTINKNIGYIEL